VRGNNGWKYTTTETALTDWSKKLDNFVRRGRKHDALDRFAILIVSGKAPIRKFSMWPVELLEIFYPFGIQIENRMACS